MTIIDILIRRTRYSYQPGYTISWMWGVSSALCHLHMCLRQQLKKTRSCFNLSRTEEPSTMTRHMVTSNHPSCHPQLPASSQLVPEHFPSSPTFIVPSNLATRSRRIHCIPLPLIENVFHLNLLTCDFLPFCMFLSRPGATHSQETQSACPQPEYVHYGLRRHSAPRSPSAPRKLASPRGIRDALREPFQSD